MTRTPNGLGASLRVFPRLWRWTFVGVIFLQVLGGVIVGVVRDQAGGGPALAVLAVVFVGGFLALVLLVRMARPERADGDESPVRRQPG